MLDKALQFFKFLLLIGIACLFFALVWWGGPELRIGDSRPLEPVGWRLFVILLVPIVLALPLVGRLYQWIWHRLSVPEASEESANLIEECQLALKTMRQYMRGIQGGFFTKRYWRVQPDIVLHGDPSSLAERMAAWPHPVVWDSGETEVGRYFYSKGLIWLVVPQEVWSDWASALRWRTQPRSLLWVVKDHSWNDAGSRLQILKELQSKLLQWRSLSFKALPLWVLIANALDEETHPAWNDHDSSTAYGFSLPVKNAFSKPLWQKLAQQLLEALHTGIVKPNTPIEVAQAKLRVYFQCAHQLEYSRSALEQLQTLRGVFWSWSHHSQLMVGWKGVLHVVQSDRVKGAARRDVALTLNVLFFVFLMLFGFFLIDQTLLRSSRHAQAQQEWFRLKSQMLQQSQQLNHTGSDIKPILTALKTLSTLNADSVDAMNESLNGTVQQALDNRQAQLVQDHLLPRLMSINIACARNRTEVKPEQLYKAIAFALMLNQPSRTDDILMQRVLEDCHTKSDDAELALTYFKRFAKPNNVGSSQIQSWRSQLTRDHAFSLSARVWSGIEDTANYQQAKNFNLPNTMGPASSWFVNNEEIPWLFTADGYVNAYVPALQYFPQWTSEYQWIMGKEESPLSRDEWESLKTLTNAKYVEAATQRWEDWFSALQLNRVEGLLQAADRALMFGSEESPITQLLGVLDQYMPLPQTKSLSWFDRFKNRIRDDWINIQFQLGWRTTAVAGDNANDPRRAIGQHFVVLRRYFSDKTGKSPDRDRLLSNITAIGQYLGQSDASDQTGVKSSQPGVLKRLQVQASQLPKPLKEMTMTLLYNSESELQKQNHDSVVTELRGIPSYKNCASGPRFPLNPKASQEMLWREFADDFSAQGRISKFIADQNVRIDSAQSGRSKRPSDANKVLASQDLRWLERTSQIGKAWFPERGAEFSFFIKPVSLHNAIRTARIRFEDQTWSYSHGQQFLQKFTWSGQASMPTIEMELTDLEGHVSRYQTTGPWGLLHWASKAKQQATNDPNKLLLDFQTEFGSLQIEVSTLDTLNPLNMKLYENLCN